MSQILHLGSPETTDQRSLFSLQRIQFAYKILVLRPGHTGPAYIDPDKIFILGYNMDAPKPNQVISIDLDDPYKWLESVRSSATLRGLVALKSDDPNIIWWVPKEDDPNRVIEANYRHLSALALGHNVDPKVAKAQGPKEAKILTLHPHPTTRPTMEAEQMIHPLAAPTKKTRPRDDKGQEIPLTIENQFSSFAAPRPLAPRQRPKHPNDLAPFLIRPGMKRS